VTSARCSAGIHAVARLLEEDPSRVKRLLIDRRIDSERIGALLETASAAGVTVQRAARNRLDDLAAGTRHQGVVAELRGASALDEAGLRTLVEQRLTAGRPLLLVVLDGVQDPHNLGACLRTADAAGVDAVVIPRREAAGITPAVRKVATGAAVAGRCDALLAIPMAGRVHSLNVSVAAGVCLYEACRQRRSIASAPALG